MEAFLSRQDSTDSVAEDDVQTGEFAFATTRQMARQNDNGGATRKRGSIPTTNTSENKNTDTHKHMHTLSHHSLLKSTNHRSSFMVIVRHRNKVRSPWWKITLRTTVGTINENRTKSSHSHNGRMTNRARMKMGTNHNQ